MLILGFSSIYCYETLCKVNRHYRECAFCWLSFLFMVLSLLYYVSAFSYQNVVTKIICNLLIFLNFFKCEIQHFKSLRHVVLRYLITSNSILSVILAVYDVLVFYIVYWLASNQKFISIFRCPKCGVKFMIVKVTKCSFHYSNRYWLTG